MENEIFENIVIDEENSLQENETVPEEENENLAVPLDYYDNYYNQVLQKLENIKTNQNTIIDKEQIIIACHQQHNASFGIICFFLGIILCYMFIRSLLNLK